MKQEHQSRGALAKEHATAVTTKPLSKETIIMSQSTDTLDALPRFTTDELLAELDRRGCDVPLWLRPVGPKVQPGSLAHLVLFRFHKVRTEAGMSQAELARQADIPATTLRETLNGDASMSFNHYVRICRALHLSTVDTLRPEEDK